MHVPKAEERPATALRTCSALRLSTGQSWGHIRTVLQPLARECSPLAQIRLHNKRCTVAPLGKKVILLAAMTLGQASVRNIET